MTNLELGFTICAALGGGLFVIRLILMFVGGIDDIEGDITDGEMDVTDSDASFQYLSFQGITAFLMMFGLAGRALLLDSGVKPLYAILGATVAGLVAVWIIERIFRAMKKLQSTGTINLREAVGQQGTVYLTIPADNIGKVRVTVRNHLKVLDAVSDGEIEIKTGEEIKVLRITGDSILVVTNKL